MGERGAAAFSRTPAMYMPLHRPFLFPLFRVTPSHHLPRPPCVVPQLDKTKVDCPMCRHHTSRLTRHINLQHNPAGPGTDERTGVYALAVVRRPGDGKFLLVQVMRARGGGWGRGASGGRHARTTARVCGPWVAALEAYGTEHTACWGRQLTPVPPCRMSCPPQLVVTTAQERYGEGYW